MDTPYGFNELGSPMTAALSRRQGAIGKEQVQIGFPIPAKRRGLYTNLRPTQAEGSLGFQGKLGFLALFLPCSGLSAYIEEMTLDNSPI